MAVDDNHCTAVVVDALAVAALVIRIQVHAASLVDPVRGNNECCNVDTLLMWLR